MWINSKRFCYTIDAGGCLDPSNGDLLPTSSLAIEMRAKFASVGLVHVTNTGLTDMKHQRELARIIMGDETEYEGGANPRGRVSFTHFFVFCDVFFAPETITLGMRVCLNHTCILLYTQNNLSYIGPGAWERV